ncbi:TRAF family member-associated NF-kappa-B activator isoform X3 [Bombina bombina]|uniref:TRAF family member-associated NF-kappa-B activator isoform X3 n=1 Tax=Bombina bombina TaxID=8345 RepID=UPI00235AC83A|nr:TRAF family member-associated NF-kappa-B activator isoform X3 [Bombina bombina]
MEKNMADQLNKAYEAYRQACMDKEASKKKWEQQKDRYEKELLDQQNQIVSLRALVKQLTAELASTAASSKAGGIFGAPLSPRLENSEVRRNEAATSVTYEQLQEQVKLSMQREKMYKEQTEMERIKFKRLEEEYKKSESDLLGKNDEIRLLKKTILKINEKKENPDYRLIPTHEMEVRSKRTLQEMAVPLSFPDDKTRQGVEQVFYEIKEEFSQISKLTREQSIYLNKLFARKENRTEVPLQFSMPIQCTDKANKDAQDNMSPKFKPDKNTRTLFASITPRGLGPDDEVSFSVESLSNLSVKFPPTDNDSEFLQSAPEKLPALNIVSSENPYPSKQQVESPLLCQKITAARCSSPDSQHSPRTICNVENLKNPGVGNNNFFPEEDSSLFLAANSPIRKYLNSSSIQDVQEEEDSVETGRMVRGPQQAIWKPQHSENDPFEQGSEKWDLDSPEICSFCQAVFPTSVRSSENFLRHLNTHFLGQS